MPWMETSPMVERWRFLERVRRGEESFSELCRKAGISRPTGYKWLRRFEATPGLEALQDRSRRPNTSPAKTSPEVVAKIHALRKRFSAGGILIARKLGEDKIQIAPRTVDRVLSRTDCIREEDRARPAVRRFQREKPNQLWQMDFKGPVPAGAAPAVPLTILDDCSRYVPELRALETTGTTGVFGTLRRVFGTYGLPDALLMDHGTPWWGPTNGHGITRLSVWLVELGITLIYSGIRHPQTQGKVERFHRTLARWLRDRTPSNSLRHLQARLSDFRELYNNERPHRALDMAVPASIYVPSARPYATPRAWVYPEGATLRTVNGWGGLSYRGQTYYVCEALIGKSVMCRELDGIVLVVYRHMVVREIDLRTRVSRPAVALDEA